MDSCGRSPSLEDSPAHTPGRSLLLAGHSPDHTLREDRHGRIVVDLCITSLTSTRVYLQAGSTKLQTSEDAPVAPAA